MIKETETRKESNLHHLALNSLFLFIYELILIFGDLGGKYYTLEREISSYGD